MIFLDFRASYASCKNQIFNALIIGQIEASYQQEREDNTADKKPFGYRKGDEDTSIVCIFCTTVEDMI